MLLCRLFALKPISLENFISDESASGSQKIWAVDPSVFSRNDGSKGKENSAALLRPVYILQPEAAPKNEGVRGYRRYDRGRSFSPPKYSTKTQCNRQSACQNPAPNFAYQKRQFKYQEGFRKSFSSEQLYFKEKVNQEPYSFSLSSRSSTTSTGSSTRSGIWQRDLKSGIPVPISSELKVRVRSNNSNGINTGVGPVVARRSALGSPIHHSTSSERSIREDDSITNVSVPARVSRSGSESSGYFTPPPDTQQAFVKLNSEDHASEEELPSTKEENNNVDEVDNYSQHSRTSFNEDVVQRTYTPSSAEASDLNEEVEVKETIEEHIIKTITKDNNVEREEFRLHRISSTSLKEPSFLGRLSGKTTPVEGKGKSKSVVDLKSFLPDITLSAGSRKNANSAPPRNDNLPKSENIVTISNIDDLPITPSKALHLGSTESVKETATTAECPKNPTTTRKLTRRFSRSQSKKSTKSTPRSVRETTPQSSRINTKPKESLQLALGQLNDPEWETTIQGLQNISEIAKHHPETIESQIHTVCISLARQIKNLRSQVARHACNTAVEIFKSCKRGLDIELEEIAGPLLQRTADTNKFLRADANSALDVMCETLPLSRVISVVTLRGCTHQNCIVRSASMRLIADIVKRVGCDKVFQMNKDIRDKILLAGANSLTDGSLEARSYAKATLSHLVGHPQFNRSLLDAVPQSTLRHIAKTLGTIKPCNT